MVNQEHFATNFNFDIKVCLLHLGFKLNNFVGFYQMHRSCEKNLQQIKVQNDSN